MTCTPGEPIVFPILLAEITICVNDLQFHKIHKCSVRTEILSPFLLCKTKFF